ncbi:MAG: YihY family inner membrane protein [Proteobacteria bacterium]|nr:MAG: YihY family inner membrane protein [Pseudomonadota bacterium]
MTLRQRGLNQIIWAFTETRRQMKESDLSILAGSLAFSTVISLVPLMAVSLSVFTAFGGMETLLHRIEPFILHNLVDASGAEISRGIRRSIARVHSGALGVGGAIGLLIASSKLFYDMERAVQRVWGIENDRRFWRRLVVYWILMFLGPLALAAILGLVGSKDVSRLAKIPRGTVVLIIEFIAIFAFYKVVPSTFVKIKAAFISAVVAVAAIGLAQAFYSTIMRTFLNVNKVYGSLASVPLFLIWLLVLWQICLTGVALCAVLNQGRAIEKKRLFY